MIINMAGGGGAKPYAFILVTYPSGSTCTCATASGSKAISSTKKLFYVKQSGTYAVSCTDGTHTKSQNVTISYEGQSASVTLAYQTILYQSGNENTSVTGGWEKYTNQSGTLTKGSSTITFRGTSYYPEAIGTTNKIALTASNSLKFTGYSADAGSGTYIVFISTSKTIRQEGDPSTLTNIVKSVNIPRSSSGTVTLSLSGLTSGNYYVGVISSSPDYNVVMSSCIVE